MSPLTKILVILVVVLSLIQTAATVVFVSRVENANESLRTIREQLAANEAKLAAAQTALANSDAQVNTVRQQAQAQVAAAQQQLLTVQQQLADRDVKLAQLSSQAALQSTDLARATEALRASEDTKAKLTDANAELRRTNDELTRRVADLNVANADLTNRLEVTERERRFMQEQNAELQNQLARSNAALKDAGMPVPTVASAVGVGRGAPPINAVVREVRTIANIPYATISAGAADRVIPGMRFTVIDAAGNFLGFLEVDNVQPNESAGRLSGPRVPDIRPGAEARTQL
ncbi:MAG: hypothetical protein ACK4PI_00945 [Tepidisphaerales bacterium]